VTNAKPVDMSNDAEGSPKVDDKTEAKGGSELTLESPNPEESTESKENIESEKDTTSDKHTKSERHDKTRLRDIERNYVARELFLHWLSSGNGIFHISGKLGSGKSTLMKFLCDHDRTTAELQK